MEDELRNKLEEYSLGINDLTLHLLRKFYNFLKKENEKTNLISRRNFDWTFNQLFFQSVWAAKKIMPFESLIDIGSGAGFPGVAIKIYYPFLRVALVEPKKKKPFF